MTKFNHNEDSMTAVETTEKAAEAAPAQTEAQRLKAENAKAKADAKAQKEADKAAKAQAKLDAEAAKAAPKVVTPKDSKNGITRPSAGVTKLVWDTADKMSADLKAPVDRGAVTAALEGQVQTGTTHTQYGRWRKYYGLSETREERRVRLDAIRTVKDAEKAEAKAKKDAEKAIKEREKAEKQEAADAKKIAAVEAAKPSNQASIPLDGDQEAPAFDPAAVATE